MHAGFGGAVSSELFIGRSHDTFIEGNTAYIATSARNTTGIQGKRNRREIHKFDTTTGTVTPVFHANSGLARWHGDVIHNINGQFFYTVTKKRGKMVQLYSSTDGESWEKKSKIGFKNSKIRNNVKKIVDFKGKTFYFIGHQKKDRREHYKPRKTGVWATEDGSSTDFTLLRPDSYEPGRKYAFLGAYTASGRLFAVMEEYTVESSSGGTQRIIKQNIHVFSTEDGQNWESRALENEENLEGRISTTTYDIQVADGALFIFHNKYISTGDTLHVLSRINPQFEFENLEVEYSNVDDVHELKQGAYAVFRDHSQKQDVLVELSQTGSIINEIRRAPEGRLVSSEKIIAFVQEGRIEYSTDGQTWNHTRLRPLDLDWKVEAVDNKLILLGDSVDEMYWMDKNGNSYGEDLGFVQFMDHDLFHNVEFELRHSTGTDYLIVLAEVKNRSGKFLNGRRWYDVEELCARTQNGIDWVECAEEAHYEYRRYDADFEEGGQYVLERALVDQSKGCYEANDGQRILYHSNPTEYFGHSNWQAISCANRTAYALYKEL